MKKIFYLVSVIFGISQTVFAQDHQHTIFSEKDSLRGLLSPARACYDVHYYDLNIKVDPDEKRIIGSNEIHFIVVHDFQQIQIDLYANLDIQKIVYDDQNLTFERKYDAVFVNFPTIQRKGSRNFIKVYYQGIPQAAKQPPWDGGFAWSRDSLGNHWVGIACEGDGASLWWPNKDHLSDEPDSMMIRCTVPEGLTCVANGNLQALRLEDQAEKGWARYDWKVSYPINNYNISLNIGKYVHFSDTYTAQDGEVLALDYYVLPYHLEKAKVHFKQVQGVLEAFEHYFGKYPFWDDGYALIETPYLGMEHQGAIAYGNRFLPGYLGMHPKGIDFDFIIVHETGHEYFGNSISVNDHAEMWIHESFTTYMEALYVEYHFGYEEATRYLIFQRSNIKNKTPMLGPLDVNYTHWGDSDYYYKGSWMLHTLRSALADDKLWFELLYELHQKNKLSNMTTDQVIDFISQKAGVDLNAFFDQYIAYADLPKLNLNIQQKKKKSIVQYQWITPMVADFNMPVELVIKGKTHRLFPTTAWKTTEFKRTKPSHIFVNTKRFLIEPMVIIE